MEDDPVSDLGEHLYCFCCPSSRNLIQNKINLRDFTTNIKAHQNKSLTIKIYNKSNAMGTERKFVSE